MNTELTLAEQVRAMYEQCDPEGRGFITREDLSRLQGQLPLEDVQLYEVFALLDKDNSGSLTLDAFTQGFGQFLRRTAPSTSEDTEDQVSDHESDAQLEQALTASGANVLLKDYEQVSRIWKQLRQQNPTLLPEFESMLSSITKELQAAKAEYENMDNLIQTKLCKQEEHLGQLFEELEQQMALEKERLLEEERAKEKKLRENLAKELKQKEQLTTELMQQYEQAQKQLEQLESTRITTIQEKERLLQEKMELEQRLTDTQSTLNECKEYIETLQKKAREDRRTRAKAAIELSENIALERENLVRQLNTLRMINRKLVDDREERRQRHLANLNKAVNDSPQTIVTHAGVHEPVAQPGETVDPFVEVEQANLDSMTDWSTHHLNPRTVPGRVTSEARRGSILGAYFNAGGPGNSSTETELEGIAETEEDEEVFISDSTKQSQDDEQEIRNRKQLELSSNSSVKYGQDEPKSTSEHSMINEFKAVQRVYNVIFIGDSGVGKSSIIHRFVTNEFNPNIHSNVGIDFQTKLIDCDGCKTVLNLWDTAGCERFRAITKQYYRRADAVVIVFDVTKETTFLALRGWIQDVKDGAEDDTIVMILSNKHDKLESADEQNELLTIHFPRLLQENAAIGFKVSAKTGSNVELAFLELTRLLKSKEDIRLNNVIKLTEETKKKKGCCR